MISFWRKHNRPTPPRTKHTGATPPSFWRSRPGEYSWCHSTPQTNDLAVAGLFKIRCDHSRWGVRDSYLPSLSILCDSYPPSKLSSLPLGRTEISDVQFIEKGVFWTQYHRKGVFWTWRPISGPLVRSCAETLSRCALVH